MGVRPECPRLGRARAEGYGGSRALSAPSHSHCSQLPTPNWSQRDLPGGQGAGRWAASCAGRTDNGVARQSPGTRQGKSLSVACAAARGGAPGSRPWEVHDVIAEGETRSKVVSRSRDWFAPSRVSHRLRLPVLCLWLHREEATHIRPLSEDTLGEPGAGAAKRNNAEPREGATRRAHTGGPRHLAAATGAQAQALEGAKSDSLRDQLN